MNTERLKILRDALNSPMPKGFQWDFQSTNRETSCGTAGCALGLAEYIWGGRDLPLTMYGEAMDFFGLSEPVIEVVFFSPTIYSKIWRDVKPQDVADAIDWLLDHDGSIAGFYL